MIIHPDQFLGLPDAGEADCDAVILPLPFERTVSYGGGVWRAPRAILDASCQVETFDEETQTDFEKAPRLHTATAVLDDADVAAYLETIRLRAEQLRDKFVLGLGGEHTVTWGLIKGLAPNLAQLTIVHLDAHADLIDELDGRRWSHGTVMRRLFEEGARLIQVGVRSLSRSEHDFIATQPAARLRSFYAWRRRKEWPELLRLLGELSGDIYLSLDIDALDPGVVPNVGTPQPGGLTWEETIEAVAAAMNAPRANIIGADLVEYVASPHPPGADIIAAKLAMKILAFWHRAKKIGTPH